MEVEEWILFVTLFFHHFDITCSITREEVHLIGSNVVLHCDGIGKDIEWICPLKDNIRYSGSSCDSQYYGGRLFKKDNVLRIVNAQKRDEGLYKCFYVGNNEEIQFTLTFPALLSFMEPAYYRSLRVDTESQTLIIGYMNYISLIDLSTSPVSSSSRKNTFIQAESSKVNNCKLSKPESPDCQNHMKILAKKTKDILILCGTNAYSPTGYEYNITDGSYVRTGDVPCSNDPFHNSTAILVETNNPDNNSHMYYGSVYYSDKTIQRPNYDTDGTIKDYIKGVDSTNWMKDPQFVFSYELEDEVLFFFRESAVEVDPNYPKTFSRVAKVCKKDLGGSTQLRNKWTSFQKARIFCKTSGTTPFLFDLLQDAVVVNGTLYGLFTSGSELPSSAICAFTVSSITQAFLGQFRHPPSAGSYWVPVATGDVPSPRPGQCTDDSLLLPDATLEFIANKPLMDIVIQPINEKAIFVMQGEELQKLEQHYDMSEIVFYAGSNRGNVYKLFIKDYQTCIISNYTIEGGPDQSNVIWSMKQFGEYLYIGTDNFVQQITVINCEQYQWIDSCVTDPHCVWINNTDLIQDVSLVPEHDYYNRCKSHSDIRIQGCNESITHDDVSLPISIPVIGPPDKPTSFRSVDATENTILLEWNPGFSGGYEQEFIIYQNSTVTYYSFTNRYTVTNLRSGVEYEFKLLAKNIIGNSSYTTSIKINTEARNVSPPTETESDGKDTRFIISILCFVVTSVLITIIIIYTVIKRTKVTLTCNKVCDGFWNKEKQ